MTVSNSFFRWTALLLAILSSYLTSQAQTSSSWTSASIALISPVSGFTNTLNVAAVTVDAAGNIYRVGSFSGSQVIGDTTITSLGQDGFIAKFSSAGTRLWVRVISSANATSPEYAESIVLDAAGNAYLAGSFQRSVDLGNSLQLIGTQQTSKGFLVRYSPRGIAEWVQQTEEGPYASAGSFRESGSVALDGAGNVYWAATYELAAIIGGVRVAVPNSTLTSGVFLARFSATTGTLHSLVPTFYSQTRFFNSPRLAVSPTGEAYISTTYLTFGPGPVVGGTQWDGQGDDDVLLMGYSAVGELNWVRRIGGSGRANAAQIGADAAGNLYVAGHFNRTASFGTTTLTVSNTSSYLAKYSPQGTELWVQPSDGDGYSNQWNNLCLDAAGNTYVTGHLSGTAHFGSDTLQGSTGWADVVVASYSPQGQARWGMQAFGKNNRGLQEGNYIGVDARGGVYVEGTFNNTIQIGPYQLTIPPYTTKNFQAWVSNSPLATQTARPATLSLYPNPASDQVQIPTLAPGAQVQFIDDLGRVARKASVSAAAQVSVRGLRPGLYILRATTAQGQQFAGRVMVE